MTENDKLSILIVDDDSGFRKTLCDILARRGFAPAPFAGGQTAIEWCAENSAVAALIDLKLEGVSGLEVLGVLKALPSAPECILLTGYASQETAIEAVNLGAFAYFQKPYDVEQLLLTVRRAVERHQAAEALRESEGRFRRLAEHSPDIIFRSGPSGLEYISPACLPISGFTPEEYYTDPNLSPSRVHPGDQPKLADLDQRLDRGPTRCELRIMHKDGHVVWTEQNLVPVFDESGKRVAVEGIVRDITARKRIEERLAHMATHDTLTGLPNRRLFNDRLNIAMARAHRNQEPLALMLLDLDRFKEVNDTLGHSVGDELLQVVGERLASLVRESDTVARMGGDEFTLILPEVAEAGDAAKVAEKILKGFQKPFVLDGHEFHVTTSIGIALYPDDGEDGDVLMKNADIAMYRAKDKGPGDYQHYSDKRAEGRKR